MPNKFLDYMLGHVIISLVSVTASLIKKPKKVRHA